MVDGEESAVQHRCREDFNLEPSIKVVPDTANSGDTVNVFAQDFPNGGGLAVIKLAGRPSGPNDGEVDTNSDLTDEADGLVADGRHDDQLRGPR